MNMTYLFLGVLLVLSFSLSVFGQKTTQESNKDSLKRAMELREQLHRRLMDHLFHGTGGNQDEIFKDMEALFEDVMKDMQKGFSDFDDFGQSKGYEMAWTESKEGRTLWISPQDKKSPLEINVEKGMISIKGKSEVKTPTRSSVSSFSHSYSVPSDCDGSKVKMLEKDGKILMSFPFNKADQKIKRDERRPLPRSQGEVTI
jgi:hypothetical protein